MKAYFDTYAPYTSYELKTIRSKKFNKLARLQNRVMGYFDRREANRLEEQIKAIDAILEARRLPTALDVK